MKSVGIIGLGYVGLPLAVAFSKTNMVLGYDSKKSRVQELQAGHDHTMEISTEELRASRNLKLTSEAEDLRGCDFFIVTVPTPVDKYNTPDLRPLISASRTVGRLLKSGGIVVYESTVYPGCTEEDCVPILVAESGLTFNKDFFCGYSPERINPGDKEHTITKIKKITSGSTPEAAEAVDALYRSVIVAGTHRASSIRVAEAAKVIENSQRDINIAFVNELSLIFERLGIDTYDVLEAAGTKWNFLPFKPGLVGGHCIGVDPFYLTHRAQAEGYYPEIILAGRRLNDRMGAEVVSRVVKLMIKKAIPIEGARVLVLGITFKENCPDIRNSKVITIINELNEFGCKVEVHDPWAAAAEVKQEYDLELAPIEGTYDAIILAVSHRELLELDFGTLRKAKSVVFDVKGVLDRNKIDARL
ncbi:MAG: nucleotide sugar dehydrogenase [Spirochaetales bacterium]